MFTFEIQLVSHYRLIMSETFGTCTKVLFVLQRLVPCSPLLHVYISKHPNDYVWSSRCAKMLCVSIAMELHLCVFIVWTLSTKHTIAKLGPRFLIHHSFLDCRWSLTSRRWSPVEPLWRGRCSFLRRVLYACHQSFETLRSSNGRLR